LIINDINKENNLIVSYTVKRKKRKLDKLYAKIPKIKCQKKCSDYCGVIDVTDIERRLVTEELGLDPFTHLQDILEKVERNEKSCLNCPSLKDGLCSIYKLRPFICRIFGVVKKLQCPHGCKPERWLTDAEVKKILGKLKGM
jgi:Fe-S-cluster containining protein